MWIGSCFFCFSASSLTFLEGLGQYLCSLSFSSPPQLFLMFPQVVPVQTCLQRSSSPDCGLADSATTSNKLPTCSCFHLLEPLVGQSCPGDQQSDRVCLPLARNLPSLCWMSVLVMLSMQGWVFTLSVLTWATTFVPLGIWETIPTSSAEFNSHGDRSQQPVVHNGSSPRASQCQSKVQIWSKQRLGKDGIFLAWFCDKIVCTYQVNWILFYQHTSHSALGRGIHVFNQPMLIQGCESQGTLILGPKISAQ